MVQPRLRFPRILLVLVLLMPGSLLPVSIAAAPSSPDGRLKLAPDLVARMIASVPEARISVVVALHPVQPPLIPATVDRAARLRLMVQQLKTSSSSAQQEILSWLQTPGVHDNVGEVTPFWIFNGFRITATPSVIRALAARSDVVRIDLDQVAIVPAGEPWIAAGAAEVAANLSVIGAPALWELGIRGQGVVVATVDTGVDETHPELLARWRGGTNSWFDPYGEHPTNPTDLVGHGTWVTGVMVAGDASGSALGVAPDAEWIGVKIFPDFSSPTRSAIHAGFQWLFDPDGDPDTADAPHVVVNSWSFGSPGCDLEFQPDLIALRAVGILPIFAGGNYGPLEGSDVSPANNPAAFAVGATNNADQVHFESSRGPSACGEAATVYPEIVAPGVDIATTDRRGVYVTETGTSLAAPHVAGGLALLLSAYPGLSAEMQSGLLLAAADDLGVVGADNVFGYGRLDVDAAYDSYDPPLMWQVFLPIFVVERPNGFRLYLPLLISYP